MRFRSRSLARRLAIGGVAALSALSLPACASPGNAPEDPESVPDIRGEDDLADPFSGAYDAEFKEDLSVYAGQEVTLSAAVDEVVAPEAFTITSPDGSAVDSSLVVVEEPVEGLEAGQQVIIAATPSDAFDVADIETRYDVDLDDERFQEWDDEAYLAASQVELSDG